MFMSVVPSWRCGGVDGMVSILREGAGTDLPAKETIAMQLAKAMILPELDLNAWSDTQTTLHRWTQIVGKTRLKFAPMQNHWWQVVLYVTSRGLSTSPIPYEGRTFEISFDFNNHELVIITSEGETRTMPLRSRSVADFYNEYLATLRSVGVSAKLWPVPVEMGDTLRFTDDHQHDT